MAQYKRQARTSQNCRTFCSNVCRVLFGGNVNCFIDCARGCGRGIGVFGKAGVKGSCSRCQ